MATISEDYVSFEIAKLLKEKGFSWDWSPFYSKQDKDEWERNNSYTIANPNYDVTIPFDSETLNVVVPHVSLQMAMKWLREVHDLHIEVLPWCADKKEKEENKKRWLCKVYKLYGMYGCDIYTNETPKSYEEACEAAIKYCLENLI